MICFYLFFALLCNQKNKNKKVNLIIDIGNTVAKLAVFNDKGEVMEVLRGSNHSLDCLKILCHK